MVIRQQLARTGLPSQHSTQSTWRGKGPRLLPE